MLAFYFFATILVYLSYKSLRGGAAYLNYFKRELSRPKSRFTPFASIIVPCRGLDEDLEENLSPLFQQEYPGGYEIVFVVDDDKDESIPVIQKLLTAYRSPLTNLVISGKTTDSGQKVHNLRRAVLEVSDESRIFVFVDSDARPSEDWLGNLIAPLENESIGAATGYRWFVQKRGGFATHFRSVWNASIASALGANMKSNFCWGGSTAIRRETFEKLQMREKWRGSLSDDFAVTRAMKAADLQIYFVPRALAASVEDCTFRELLEFTTRQMKITRVYAPHLWKASFIGSFLFNLVFIWGILIIAFGSIDEFSFWFSVTCLILISAFSLGKSWFRLNAVKLVLKDYEKELRRQFWTQNTLWMISPALFLYNSIRALLSRKILWRGIKYELKSPAETVIINSNAK